MLARRLYKCQANRAICAASRNGLDEKKALSSRELGLTWSVMKRLHLLLYCGVTVNRSFVRAPRLAASLGADGASVSTMKYSLGRVAAGQKAEKAGIFAPVYRIDSWA